MFSYLEGILVSFANSLPLEVFVGVASFIEEVVAPIPSPTVMLVAGSFARVQDYTLIALVSLAIIGAFGKTIGALVVYKITDRAEDFVMHRFGKFFGVTHEDVARFGRKIGKGKRDYLVMTIFRALPFVPSVLVSVGSGLLKVPMPLFIISTFLGTILRDGFYLYAGYVGAVALGAFIATSTHIESYIEVVAVVVVVYVVARHIYKKRASRRV